MNRASYCYLLYCGNRTYIGATYDPHKRLEQHNGIRAGGARATHGKQWTLALFVSGFPDWNNTLSFEWAWKREARNKPGVYGKIGGLRSLLLKRKSTSNATPYIYWPSGISMYILPNFNEISEKIEQFQTLKSMFVLASKHLSFQSFCFQLFFLSNEMSVSSDVVSALAQKVEELSLDLNTLKTQLAAALDLMSAEPKARKPRAKKAEVNEIVGDKSEKKPRKPRAKKVADTVVKADEPKAITEPVAADSESATEKKPRKPRAKKAAEVVVVKASEPTATTEVATAPVSETAPVASDSEKAKATTESGSESEKKPRKPRAKKVVEQTVAAPTA
jgi:predicted GIY-YIG superfamily endonuclease